MIGIIQADAEWQSSLKAYARLHGLSLPEYEVMECGPDHQKWFRAEVTVGGRILAGGKGCTMNEAQDTAARMALRALTKVNREDSATAVNGDLDSASLRDAPATRQGKRVAPTAAGLLAGAVRVLPAAQRMRYAEEYRSELWDLAQASKGRLSQLRYSFRQICRALPTGIALRSPRRRGAAP